MSEDDRVNAVKEWAEPVAKKIINEGYFRIGNHYCIRVDILELYYNEEAEGGLKDPIMYHTNDRIPKHLNVNFDSFCTINAPAPKFSA